MLVRTDGDRLVVAGNLMLIDTLELIGNSARGAHQEIQLLTGERQRLEVQKTQHADGMARGRDQRYRRKTSKRQGRH